MTKRKQAQEQAEQPLSVRIGGYDMQVVFDAMMMREGLLGEIDTVNLTIRLMPDMPMPMVARVMLHEIIHGILENAGINEHDEQIVDAIANGFVQVFRDNPYLAEWLCEKQGA